MSTLGSSWPELLLWVLGAVASVVSNVAGAPVVGAFLALVAGLGGLAVRVGRISGAQRAEMSRQSDGEARRRRATRRIAEAVEGV